MTTGFSPCGESAIGLLDSSLDSGTSVDTLDYPVKHSAAMPAMPVAMSAVSCAQELQQDRDAASVCSSLDVNDLLEITEIEAQIKAVELQKHTSNELLLFVLSVV